MFIPQWVLLLVVVGVFCYFNPELGKKVSSFLSWVMIGIFTAALSPFLGCLSVAQYVFKWEKDDWKTQLFTVGGGFGLIYLVVFLFFAPK